LKPAHAIAMHGILVLPLLAWLLSRTDWSEERKLRLIVVAATGYVALASVVGVVNVAGLGLTSPPIATTALLAALSAVATGWLTTRTQRGLRR
jgi:peptidoglycan/LPS O-acetylase OafA/YrhL